MEERVVCEVIDKEDFEPLLDGVEVGVNAFLLFDNFLLESVGVKGVEAGDV
jgi:hypothetical protein